MKAHKKRVVYKCGKSFVTKTYYSRKDNTADRDRTAEYALRAIGRAVARGVLRGAEKRARPKPEGEEHVEMPPARIEENRRGFEYTGGGNMDALDRKIVDVFPGKIVRKDLTAMLKRGANVPTFVLEYLLGIVKLDARILVQCTSLCTISGASSTVSISTGFATKHSALAGCFSHVGSRGVEGLEVNDAPVERQSRPRPSPQARIDSPMLYHNAPPEVLSFGRVLFI